ncbi:YcxB family protein [Leptospira venezuelensis]|uniref:YcxB family protein n=1 Tax=Leptospira venezuelensis TaxID=1958811 RepID=UPI000A37EFF4|nr:YcxB family protein [Leptospira venezuelensis]
MNYKVKGRVSLEDYSKFINYHIYLSLLGGFRKFIFVFLGLVLFLFYVLPILKKLPPRNETEIVEVSQFLARFLVIFAIALISYLFFKFRLSSRNKKTFESNKFLQDEQTFDIGENQILASSPNSNTIITKDKIHKLAFKDDAIYIFISAIQAFVIPKHYFDNDNEFGKAQNFLKEHYLK